MKKFLAIGFLAVMIAASGLSGGAEDTASLQSLFGVTQSDMDKYLETVSKNDPATYRFLLDLKAKDEQQYQRALMAGVMREKTGFGAVLSGSEDMNRKLVDALKKNHGLDEKDIENYLKELSVRDRQMHAAVVDLRKEKPALTETLILQEIAAKRADPQGANAGMLEEIVVREQIRALVDRHASAADMAKADMEEELRQLVTRSLDIYVNGLDRQIKSLKRSVEQLEKTKNEFTVNRNRKIQERLDLYLDR